MRTKINRIIQTIAVDLANLLRLLAYVLFALYVIEILYDIELSPSFPLQGDFLFVGGVVFFIISMLIKVWLLRGNK